MTLNTKHIPPELILIVEPRAQLRLREGKVIAGVDIEPLRDLLDSEQAVIHELFGISADYKASSTTLMGKGQPLDLSLFYKISSSNERLESLASRLHELAFQSNIQAAYLKPAADVAFPERTKDFTGKQEYLRPAEEGGIDAHFAWLQNGGLGTGVTLIDIEGGWNFSHEDLVDKPSSCVAGVSVVIPKWRTHGTAVIGMLGGDHNNFGIKGICPDAEVRTVSIFDNDAGEPSPQWGAAKAIKSAADMLSPGDIILIELHRAGPAVCFQENEQTQEGYIPVEWWPCDMAAILYATTRGILVVAAAGNGQENLGADIYNQNPKAPHGPFPHWWVNPFKRDPIDTGAVLVGAGVPPLGTHGTDLGPDCSRAEISNFGKVIDAQGWGVEVATCGGNNDLGEIGDPENRHYTRRFQGTSSATAMVAGALCCLQGVLKKKKKTLTPGEARDLLRDNSLGSPQQNGPLGPAAAEPIGPRPDLRKLIDHF